MPLAVLSVQSSKLKLYVFASMSQTSLHPSYLQCVSIMWADFSYEHDVECTTRFVLQDPTRRSHFQFLSPRLEVPPQPTAVPKYAIKLAERLYLVRCRRWVVL